MGRCPIEARFWEPKQGANRPSIPDWLEAVVHLSVDNIQLTVPRMGA